MNVQIEIDKAWEKVVDGVLCRRTTPDGVWLPYSAEALTAMLAVERSVSGRLNKRLESIMGVVDKLEEMRAVLATLKVSK